MTQITPTRFAQDGSRGADTPFVTLFAPSTAAQRPGSAGVRARRRTARAGEPVAYDFRQPIQLSREHARILQLGLDGFARQATTVFTSALRTVCSVQLLSINQESYAEYVDSLQAPTYLTKFSAEPMPGHGVLEIPLPATMSCIDHMLGGPGAATQPIRPLTEIEGGVVRGFVERLLGEMRYSLTDIVELDPDRRRHRVQPAVRAGRRRRRRDGGRHLRPADQRAVLPDDDLPAVHRPAAAPAQGRRARARSPTASAPSARSAAELVQRQFEEVPVEVDRPLPHHPLDPRHACGLAVGDVLRLAHPASAPLDVTVDEKTFAHATAGAQGPRLAALIVGTPKENR